MQVQDNNKKTVLLYRRNSIFIKEDYKLCLGFFLSALNVIICHSAKNTKQLGRVHLCIYLEHKKQTKDFVK